MARVLLAENDTAVAEPLARALTREGYDITVSKVEPEVADMAPEFDVVVMGIALPDATAVEVARDLRAKGHTVPVLVLTAGPDNIEKIVTLGVEADDYVTKPFRLAELLARVRALVRAGHGNGKPGKELRAQDVRLSTKSRKAYQGDSELHLTSKEFDLLQALIEQAGTPIKREALTQQVWGGDPQGSAKNLDMHISWLRRKLGDSVEAPRYIGAPDLASFQFEAAAA